MERTRGQVAGVAVQQEDVAQVPSLSATANLLVVFTLPAPPSSSDVPPAPAGEK